MLRRMWQRRTEGSLVCPHCGKLIGVDEPQCPFCGTWQPGLFGWAPALQQIVGSQLDLIRLIMTVCFVLYGLSLLVDPGAIARSAGLFSLLSPSSQALYQLGMTGGLAWQLGWWWTPLTAIYLHGGLFHIAFNVLWIRDLGPEVVDLYGPARAFVLFVFAGAVGFLVSNVASGAPTIGASGSIFGLLAALIVYGRRRGSRRMSSHIWRWAIVLFIFGLLMPAVNNLAHAGGFAGGWIAASAMRFSDERRESPQMLLLALALIVLTAAGFVLSFISWRQATRMLLG